MTEYVYVVRYDTDPGFEEQFETFEEAKELALGNMSRKPRIVEIGVSRDDDDNVDYDEEQVWSFAEEPVEDEDVSFLDDEDAKSSPDDEASDTTDSAADEYDGYFAPEDFDYEEPVKEDFHIEIDSDGYLGVPDAKCDADPFDCDFDDVCIEDEDPIYVGTVTVDGDDLIKDCCPEENKVECDSYVADVPTGASVELPDAEVPTDVKVEEPADDIVSEPEVKVEEPVIEDEVEEEKVDDKDNAAENVEVHDEEDIIPESVNKSEVNKPVDKKHCSENDSENLTLNEADGEEVDIRVADLKPGAQIHDGFEDKIVTVTDIAPQGDGTFLLHWDDNKESLYSGTDTLKAIAGSLKESAECDDMTDEEFYEALGNALKKKRLAKESAGCEEDYTGTPEERTTHLEYVDNDVTDSKAVLPKNITKKEDDHCEKVNPVINHDPDDKDVLKEGLEESDLKKKLADWTAYVAYLQDQIKDYEAKSAKEKNEFVKSTIDSTIESLKAELETALPEKVKAETAAKAEDDAKAAAEDVTDVAEVAEENK